MRNPKVSVITAAYNAENFLGRTLESVLSQTYKFVAEPLFCYNIADQNTTTKMSQEAILKDMVYLVDKHKDIYFKYNHAHGNGV